MLDTFSKDAFSKWNEKEYFTVKKFILSVGSPSVFSWDGSSALWCNNNWFHDKTANPTFYHFVPPCFTCRWSILIWKKPCRHKKIEILVSSAIHNWDAVEQSVRISEIPPRPTKREIPTQKERKLWFSGCHFCNKINQLEDSYALVYISLMKQERNAFKMLAGCKMQTHEPRRWFFVSARLLNSLVSVDEDLSKVCKRWESCVKFVEARPPQIQDRKLAGNAAIWDIHEIQKEKKQDKNKPILVLPSNTSFFSKLFAGE